MLRLGEKASFWEINMGGKARAIKFLVMGSTKVVLDFDESL